MVELADEWGLLPYKNVPIFFYSGGLRGFFPVPLGTGTFFFKFG